MINLSGGMGELRATITIVRAATGAVENYDIVGTVSRDDAVALGATIVEPTPTPDQKEEQ